MILSVNWRSVYLECFGRQQVRVLLENNIACCDAARTCLSMKRMGEEGGSSDQRDCLELC